MSGVCERERERERERVESIHTRTTGKEENGFRDDNEVDVEDFEPMHIDNNNASNDNDIRNINGWKFITIVGTFIVISIAFLSISVTTSSGNYYTNTIHNESDHHNLLAGKGGKESDSDSGSDSSGSTSKSASSAGKNHNNNVLVGTHEKDDDDYYLNDNGPPQVPQGKSNNNNNKMNKKSHSTPTRTSKGGNPNYKKVTKQDGKMYETIGDVIYHDKKHFTQGLTYSKDTNRLYESNGLYGQSSVCRLEPSTGESMNCIHMDHEYFAEGMQIYKTKERQEERLIQVTWKNRMGFIYDADTLDTISNFTFTSTRNEGWGLTVNQDDHEFILSDGSENLHFMDMETLQEVRRLPVIRQTGMQARNINELEYYNGKILANVWYEDVILVIDPITGKCDSEYDMSMLWPVKERRKKGADVLNGISISEDDGVLYITGKNWDRMFKLKLKHLE